VLKKTPNLNVAGALAQMGLAKIYASDGAIISAIRCTKAALVFLRKEKKRRVEIGLIREEKRG